MISTLPVPIIIGTVVQLMAMIRNRPLMWVSIPQRLGLLRYAWKCLGMGQTIGRQDYLTGAQNDPEGPASGSFG